jgi:hypothetical protein
MKDIMKFLSDFQHGFGIGIKIKLLKCMDVVSINYLYSENKKPILSTLYQNQIISVHSNIAHEDTYP